MPVTAALTSEEATGLLRGAGLRVTRQRVATLRALAVHRHATADDIVTSLRDELPKGRFQAVYHLVADVLAAGQAARLGLHHAAGRHGLRAPGLASPLAPPGQARRYELERRANHPHAMCTGCGRVEDVPCAVGAAPCLHPSDTHDMDIAVADVLFRGLCRDCRQRSALRR